MYRVVEKDGYEDGGMDGDGDANEHGNSGGILHADVAIEPLPPQQK